MSILSIQSHVAYGHVGNAAATFPLQRLGVEVWPIHTVQFSNHTGYGSWRGQVFGADSIRELVAGMDARGVLSGCEGVISGYIGSADIGEAVLDAVTSVRLANPEANYCCDPVIGDVGRGVFVAPGIAEFMRERALPAADVITPNHFELDFLSGQTTTTLAGAVAAARSLRARGPRTVLVTSLRTEETPAGSIDLIACDSDGCWRVRTPNLPIEVNGAGDAVAALFFLHCLRNLPVAEALSQAASVIFGVLVRTEEKGSPEILLIAAQDELVHPTRIFHPEPVGG